MFCCTKYSNFLSLSGTVSLGLGPSLPNLTKPNVWDQFLRCLRITEKYTGRLEDMDTILMIEETMIFTRKIETFGTKNVEFLAKKKLLKLEPSPGFL